MIDWQILYSLINANIFIVIAIMLILGYFVANLTSMLNFPKDTGYLITGIFLGVSGLGIINKEILNSLDFIPEFTLGIVSIMIGASFSRELLRHFKRQLIGITLTQTIVTFSLALGSMLLFGMNKHAALPLAAIATATAPAATISIIKQYKAYGSLTNMILAVVALDHASAIFIYSIILTYGLVQTSIVSSFGHFQLFFYEIINSIVIGSGLAVISHYLIRKTRGSEENVLILLSMILFGIGLSKVIFASSLLTNMFFGFMLINISHFHKQHVVLLEKFTPPLYCLFFILAGAHLEYQVFMKMGFALTLWAVVFIISRGLGKVSGAIMGSYISGASPKIKKYLGWALLPQTGIAIGMTMLITETSIYYPYKDVIINITLAGVAVNELLGPVLFKWALVKSGEAIIEGESIMS